MANNKSHFLQHELLDTIEVRKQKQDAFDQQLTMLPADPMQIRLAQERIELSKREYEILSRVLTGYSIAEIALSIFLSIAGVKFRLSSIYRKFGVWNRLELIKKSTKESLQFYVEGSPIKQVFHNRLSFADFKEDKDES